ncbi:MAG: NADH-quinone oxidoreductase subunit C [Candidatus Nanopelagicales bacterium]
MSENEIVNPNETPILKNVIKGAFGSSTQSGDTSGFGGLVTTISQTPNAKRPYGSYFDQIADALARALKEEGLTFEQCVERVIVQADQLTFMVKKEHLLKVAQLLRDDSELRFEMCMGVSGVHWPKEKDRELHAIYPFVSITHNRRVLVEVVTPDSNPHIPSITSIYPSNNWHERETYDFFGIIFDGHPALTRIEMPDDWVGHPQRKDYPLGGIPVEYKGAVIPAPDNRRNYHG